MAEQTRAPRALESQPRLANQSINMTEQSTSKQAWEEMEGPIQKSSRNIYSLRLPAEFSETARSELQFSYVWKGFKDFTTAHGVPHVNTARGPLKQVFWALVTMGCLAMLTYNMFYLFDDYLRFPVNVNVKIRSKKKIDFPAITICNVNPIRRDLLMNSDDPEIRELLGISESTATATLVDGINSDVNGVQQNTVEQQNMTGLQNVDILRQTGQQDMSQQQGAQVQQGESGQQSWAGQPDGIPTQGPGDQGSAVSSTSVDTAAYPKGNRPLRSSQDSIAVNSLTTGSPNTATHSDSLGVTAGQGGGHLTAGSVSGPPLPGPPARRRRQAQPPPGPASNTGGNNGGGGDGGPPPPPREDFQLQQKIREALSEMDYKKRQALGHQLDEMMLDCSFAGYSCNLTTDFNFVYNNAYGNCFVYNWGMNTPTTAIHQSRRPGPLYGLEMTILIDQFEYIGDLADTAGIRVLIDSHSAMPFPEDIGLSVSPGLETSIGIQLTNVTRLGAPHGSCVSVDTSDTKRNVFAEELGTVYSNKACQKTCYQRILIQNCSCADPQYPKYGAAFDYVNVTTCNSSDDKQELCQDDVEDAFVEDELLCDCPMPCLQVMYKPTVSSVSWPSSDYKSTLHDLLISAAASGNQRAHFLLQNNFDRHYQSNIAKVVIYYQEFNYEEIYETPTYTLGQFVSGLGGILGLYIGFSIFTILEFCELAFDAIVLALFKCCVKDKRKPAPQ